MLQFTREQIAKDGLNILLVGVGGQGTIMASNILAESGLNLGFDVKKAEIHGMSQRGGSVISQLRWGKKVYSPIVPQGEVDFLIAFEKLEAGRYKAGIKNNGVVLVNDQKMPPITVSARNAVYPSNEQLEMGLREKTQNIYWIQASHLAEELGDIRTANIIMIGALSIFISGDAEAWIEAIQKRIPEKYSAINLKAFEIGRSAIMRYPVRVLQ